MIWVHNKEQQSQNEWQNGIAFIKKTYASEYVLQVIQRDNIFYEANTTRRETIDRSQAQKTVVSG